MIEVEHLLRHARAHPRGLLEVGRLALRTARAVPKCISSAFLRAGPMPGTSSSGLYRREPFASDRDRVEHLFGRYEALVNPLATSGVKANRRVARGKRVGS